MEKNDHKFKFSNFRIQSIFKRINISRCVCSKNHVRCRHMHNCRRNGCHLLMFDVKLAVDATEQTQLALHVSNNNRFIVDELCSKRLRPIQEEEKTNVKPKPSTCLFVFTVIQRPVLVL